MGKGLRERWAVGKEECASGIEKRVIFGGAPGVSRFGEVESDFDTGALRNMFSRKEFRRGRRRKCRNEQLENLYQKAPCRGVLRGYQRNRLAERGSRSRDCLKSRPPLRGGQEQLSNLVPSPFATRLARYATFFPGAPRRCVLLFLLR
jgi:hypothetical protein